MEKIRNNWVVKFLCIVFCCVFVFVFIGENGCSGPFIDLADTTGCGYLGHISILEMFAPSFLLSPPVFIGVLFVLVASVVYLIFALPKLFRLRLETETETETKYHSQES